MLKRKMIHIVTRQIDGLVVLDVPALAGLNIESRDDKRNARTETYVSHSWTSSRLDFILDLVSHSSKIFDPKFCDKNSNV
jgi:hypothetical protein